MVPLQLTYVVLAASVYPQFQTESSDEQGSWGGLSVHVQVGHV